MTDARQLQGVGSPNQNPQASSPTLMSVPTQALSGAKPSGAKPSGSNARDWRPTPIDWSLEFPRSPQHLSNQLRGKRFNADKPQLQLFDKTYEDLPEDVRAEVDKHNINVVGFDLSVPQQRAYEAGLYLITATGARPNASSSPPMTGFEPMASRSANATPVTGPKSAAMNAMRRSPPWYRWACSPG
ncbi:MAG: hypothetical protein HC898_06460 [Phycisphaerales bacterium]|nr:hypothetical protein [Phycisphaerales bacterium]